MKIRYAVIGIKGAGRYHIRTALNNKYADLVALVDIDEAHLRNEAKKLNVRDFINYKDLINENIVDAVCICTPHHSHSTMTIDCLNAGLHVFKEKPLAMTVSEADAIISLAREKNLKVGVGHQYRTFMCNQVIKNIVESGSIGDIKRVLWTWVSFRPEIYYYSKWWHSTFEKSGAGILMNQVSHDLDLICWIIGQRPIQVSAIMSNHLHEAEIEDIVCVNILFEKGAIGTFQFTTNYPQEYNVRQLYGDKGFIIVNDVKTIYSEQGDSIVFGKYEGNLNKLVNELPGTHDQPKMFVKSAKLPKKHKTTSRMPFRFINNFLIKNIADRLYSLTFNLLKPNWIIFDLNLNREAVINSFFESIKNDGEPLVDAESTKNAVELVNAIILSSIKKKTVDLPIDRGEYDELFEKLKTGEIRVSRFRS